MKRAHKFFKSLVIVMLSSLLLVFTPITTLPELSQELPSLFPFRPNISLKAKAATDCFKLQNGVMTLYGQVNIDSIKSFDQKDKVKKIVASKGTILPSDCSWLFNLYKNCESIDLSLADSSHVTKLEGMFGDCSKLQTLNLKNLNTKKVTSFFYLFYKCESLTSVDLTPLDTSNATEFEYVFYGCKNLKSVDLSGLNVSKVTDMSGLFIDCEKLETVKFGKLNTKNVTNMSHMFLSCSSLKSLDLSGLNTSNVTTMWQMFAGCSNLKSLNISNFETRNVDDMDSMFRSCKSLKSLDVSSFNTTNLKNASSMFEGCSGLEALDLSNFDTSNVQYMNYIFKDCSNLRKLNIVNFVITSSTYCTSLFSNLNNLNELTIGKGITKIDDNLALPNGEYGWACSVRSGDRISGNGKYANFTNRSIKPYYKRSPLVGTVKISGTPAYNQILSVSVTETKCPKNDLSYQWYRGETLISNVTTSTYTVVKEDIGSKLTCKVTDKTRTYTGSLSATTATITKGNTATRKVTDVFSDIPKNAWYIDAVQFVYDRGIMNGTSKTTFAPLQTLNRGQFVTVLHNMIDDSKTTFKKGLFKDVKESYFFAIPVTWAAQNDIASGTGDQMFHPEWNITREQMAVMLYKFAKYQKYEITIKKTALNAFPDKSSVDDWAVEAMKWAVTNKIINGKASDNGNILDPLGNATRAECAQVILNFMNAFKKN